MVGIGRLEGKVALITGAAGGIGLAMARRFVAEGAQVFGVDRSQRRLDAALDGFGPGSDRVVFHRADVAEEASVEAFVAAAAERFGGLDVLVANAGVGGWMVPVQGTDVANFMETIRINLVGPMLLIKHGAPRLIARRSGAIIVTASIAGQRANSGPIDYSASKAGVISLVQNTAQSLGRKGVRVNALCPAGTATPMTKPSFDFLEAAVGSNPLAEINPMRRIGAAEDMADAALFLASDESRYINGQALNVCGGLSAAFPAPAIITDSL
ncbi:MAG: SDR family NAD(P)-dependent oxidoreductase [bacterium]